MVVSIHSKDSIVHLGLRVLDPLALINKDTPEDTVYRVSILIGHVVNSVVLLVLDRLVNLRGKLTVLLIQFIVRLLRLRLVLLLLLRMLIFYRQSQLVGGSCIRERE